MVCLNSSIHFKVHKIRNQNKHNDMILLISNQNLVNKAKNLFINVALIKKKLKYSLKTI